MYGVQNHRSYSTGVNVLGSRFANASSGLVSALTYSLRYCPGWLASCCATRRGTITASSSSPPLSRMPTALRNSGGAEGPRSMTDRKSTGLNSSHSQISYAVFCLKKKKIDEIIVLYTLLYALLVLSAT